MPQKRLWFQVNRKVKMDGPSYPWWFFPVLHILPFFFPTWLFSCLYSTLCCVSHCFFFQPLLCFWSLFSLDASRVFVVCIYCFSFFRFVCLYCSILAFDPRLPNNLWVFAFCLIKHCTETVLPAVSAFWTKNPFLVFLAQTDLDRNLNSDGERLKFSIWFGRKGVWMLTFQTFCEFVLFFRLDLRIKQLGWHGSAGVSAVLKSWVGFPGVCLRFCVLLISALVPSRCFRIPPTNQRLHVRIIGDSKLPSAMKLFFYKYTYIVDLSRVHLLTHVSWDVHCAGADR